MKYTSLLLYNILLDDVPRTGVIETLPLASCEATYSLVNSKVSFSISKVKFFEALEKYAIKTSFSKTIPTGKMHAHSCVLGPEFGIQCTYMYVNVKTSEHHRFELDTLFSPLSQEIIL